MPLSTPTPTSPSPAKRRYTRGSAPARSPIALFIFTAALFNGLFDKYGLKVEHVTLRGGIVSLAALSADEIQFIYCSADPMIPRMAAGAEAKMIGSTIVGLPWVLVGRKEIKRPQDLKGKSIAVSRPGGLTDQLAKAVMKKFNFTHQDLKLVHIGGTGQLEPYNAMVQGLTQATFLPRRWTCAPGAMVLG